MEQHEQPEQERADAFISIRLHEEDKALVAEAAKREGLQLSSFFIFLLVKCKILPENRLLRIKRKPVENYKALHGLLGLVNKLGGLCKQIARFQPDAEGLIETRESLIHAAAAIADCLNGKEPADSLNLSLINRPRTARLWAAREAGRKRLSAIGKCGARGHRSVSSPDGQNYLSRFLAAKFLDQ